MVTVWLILQQTFSDVTHFVRCFSRFLWVMLHKVQQGELHAISGRKTACCIIEKLRHIEDESISKVI